MALGRVLCLISTKQAKVMKVSDDRRLGQAVFLWFTQKRSEGVSISDSFLCEKAIELSRRRNEL